GWLLHHVISDAGSTADQSTASAVASSPAVAAPSAPATLGPAHAVSARAVVAASAVTAARARRRRVGRPGAVRWDTGAPAGRAPGLGALRGPRAAAGGPGSRLVGEHAGARPARGGRRRRARRREAGQPVTAPAVRPATRRRWRTRKTTRIGSVTTTVAARSTPQFVMPSVFCSSVRPTGRVILSGRSTTRNRSE